MQLPTGVELIAATCALAATVATIAMLASSRRRVGAARQAHLLFVAGGALAAVTVVVGLTGVVYYGSSHWAHHSAERGNLATVVALGAGLATAVMCVGLLRLPWAAGSRGVAGRHLLDALVIGFALWFVGWVLVSEPTQILGSATPNACPPILISAATAALAVGITVVVVMRGAGSRARLALLGTGITAVGVAGAGLATGICFGGPTFALVSAAALPVALGMVWLASRGDDPDAAVELDVIRRGTAVAFLPILAMAITAMWHVMNGGNATVMGVALASLEGFALVGRQYVALYDVRRYAEPAAGGRVALQGARPHRSADRPRQPARAAARPLRGGGRRPAVRAARPRPRRLQERQRHARPRRRRRRCSSRSASGCG